MQHPDPDAAGERIRPIWPDMVRMANSLLSGDLSKVRFLPSLPVDVGSEYLELVRQMELTNSELRLADLSEVSIYILSEGSWEIHAELTNKWAGTRDGAITFLLLDPNSGDAFCVKDILA